ncbi:uncharacterized protein B0I36DRAFT_329965 [Microdochium trichocladiopsis]|uniref:Uncharacterized protein n=1 Tax=Microdochium trichocladiopsis TaxID=1682393 RepID=A0A9P9BMC4_9PEZI|nr:uncharacterized protein B0I36DRAFT_329965 [Microdochium trichocladiopsis]KAH7026140.1 hypothetical protein B0I36DRAFT_329965 [Microdochium trichocladiopsis]
MASFLVKSSEARSMWPCGWVCVPAATIMPPGQSETTKDMGIVEQVRNPRFGHERRGLSEWPSLTDGPMIGLIDCDGVNIHPVGCWSWPMPLKCAFHRPPRSFSRAERGRNSVRKLPLAFAMTRPVRRIGPRLLSTTIAPGIRLCDLDREWFPMGLLGRARPDGPRAFLGVG